MQLDKETLDGINEAMKEMLSANVPVPQNGETEEEPTIAQKETNPTIGILNNIRNLCDNIQTNILNAGITEMDYELLKIENELAEYNSMITAILDYQNNLGRKEILTGDIVLQ